MCRELDWERIRADYETGSTQSELSRRYEVSRTSIQRHIAAEGWIQGDVREAISRCAEAKSAGIGAGCTPEKMAEAIGAAADRLVAIKNEQRGRVARLVVEWNKAVESGDFNHAKLVKISSESLKLIQEEERRVWGITDAPVEQRQNMTISWAQQESEA